MPQEKSRPYKRRLRDKFRYLSNVSILSSTSDGSEANWKMRIPSLKANQLPEDLLDIYEEAFYLLDPNDSGAIGVREVGIVMRAIGQDPTDEEIKNIINECDRSGTGSLTFNDFLAFLAHIHQEEDSEEEWEFVFDRFDRNGDGYIDEGDLRKTLIELRVKFTDADIDEMISEFLPARRSSPPRLSFDDFLAIVT